MTPPPITTTSQAAGGGPGKRTGLAPVIGKAHVSRLSTRRCMKVHPASNFRNLQIFVGLMRLRDVAGAADDGGIALALELPGFGAVADHMAAVVAGQAAHQRLGLALRFGAQGRHAKSASR
jgi:hypothetical protein